MLTKCVKCRFNIRKAETYCPNCGFVNLPQDNTNTEKIDLNFQLLISLFVIFFLIGLLIFSAITPNAPFIFFAIILSIAIAIPFHNLIVQKQVEGKKKKLKNYNNYNLIQKDNLVSKRMVDLNQRNGKLTALLNKIGNSPTKNLQEIRQKLLSAQEIIISQFVRYELQKKRIELVRLQNKVLPYLENVEILEDYQTENGIIESENVMKKIVEISQNLSETYPSSFRDERQNFLHQLQETSYSCETLREVLLSKQALRALQSVQPIENIDNVPQTKEISHAIETFNIQANLTEFGESFEQLEREYQRLLADKEISNKLLNYEN